MVNRMTTEISDDAVLEMRRDGNTGLAFASIDEREVAWRIIETWHGMVTNLIEMGEHLCENGEALQEYGGMDYLEGRARIHAGMEIQSLAQIIVMKARADDRGLALESLDRLVSKFEMIDGVLKTDDPEAVAKVCKKLYERCPPQDPVKLKAEAEARLVKLREQLAEVEQEPCVQENVEERDKLLRNIRRCEHVLASQARAEKYEEPESVPEEEIDIKVRVLAHEGNIVVIPEAPEDGINDNWWPTGGDKLGCVVGDTRRRLGVSKEALDLMREVKLGRDSLGDIDWWRCDDGTYAFSWWGAICRIIRPRSDEGARTFKVHPGEYVEIPNDVPAEIVEGCRKSDANEMLDEEGKPFRTAWGFPLTIEPDPYTNEKR